MSVLKGLNKNAVEEVDLSNNKIGYEGMNYISDLLIKSDHLSNSNSFNLKVLKLE